MRHAISPISASPSVRSKLAAAATAGYFGLAAGHEDRWFDGIRPRPNSRVWSDNRASGNALRGSPYEVRMETDF
jgi:hypothetical protein